MKNRYQITIRGGKHRSRPPLLHVSGKWIFSFSRNAIILAVLLSPCVSWGGEIKAPAHDIFTLVEKGICGVVGVVIPCSIPVKRVKIVPNGDGRYMVVESQADWREEKKKEGDEARRKRVHLAE
jgi:hypothetical protein